MRSIAFAPIRQTTMPVLSGLRSDITSSHWLTPRRLARLGLAASLMLGIILSGSIAHSEVIPPVPTDLRPPESIAPLTRAALLDRLAASNVVYLGEYHDRVYDHQAQLEIIRELQARNPNLTIAMEMFQRPFQGAIDAYLAGEIDEAELIDRTEYETRWGYPWELYAPILRFARESGIPVIAANAPVELTRKVAAEGLAGLSGDDFRYVPPIEDIRLDDENYRNALYQLFQMHMNFRSNDPSDQEDENQNAKDSKSVTKPFADLESQDNPTGTADIVAENPEDAGFNRFFAAQVLWDETIAEAIATAYQANPDRLIVVMAGRGHIAYNFGIPNRVQRRVIGEPHDTNTIHANTINSADNGVKDQNSLIQTSVFFAQQEADRESSWQIPDTLERDLVDYFWSF